MRAAAALLAIASRSAIDYFILKVVRRDAITLGDVKGRDTQAPPQMGASKQGGKTQESKKKKLSASGTKAAARRPATVR